MTNKLRNRTHCLSSLLAHSNPANYMFNLRPRGHDLSLPSSKRFCLKNSFIMRALFKYKLSVFVFFIEYAWHLLLFNTYCLRHFIVFVILIILIVLCSRSCNSVRMSLKSIIGNLLTYLLTFGSLLSQFRLSVVCRLSVVNLGAPYSGGWTFRQYFFTAVYVSHTLTSLQNFT